MTPRRSASHRTGRRRLAGLVTIALAAFTWMVPASLPATAAPAGTAAVNTFDWQSCSNSQFDHWAASRFVGCGHHDLASLGAVDLWTGPAVPLHRVAFRVRWVLASAR